MKNIIFVVDYMCTEEDYPLLEYLKLEPEDKVLVNIDGAWLKRKDMECMFNDNMQFDDNVSTFSYF
jgi:hypothetical protein